MGINIVTREELIDSKLNPEELTKFVVTDSLAFLSVFWTEEGGAVEHGKEQLGKKWDTHVAGDYPGGLPEDLDW